MSIIIAPSILSADFANLASEIKKVEDAAADWIHVDVMDGHFVPNLTIGAPVVKAIRKQTHLPLDVHLMVTNPDAMLADFAKAGANHAIVHVEAINHLQRTLTYIHSLGMKAGVALNPATPPETISYVLDVIDIVLVMTVNPGFGGQKFIQAVVPKITQVRKMLNQAGRGDVLISVDGGVGTDNAKLLFNAGAQVLVAGSSIYGSTNIASAIAALRDTAGNSTKSSPS